MTVQPRAPRRSLMAPGPAPRSAANVPGRAYRARTLLATNSCKPCGVAVGSVTSPLTSLIIGCPSYAVGQSGVTAVGRLHRATQLAFTPARLVGDSAGDKRPHARRAFSRVQNSAMLARTPSVPLHRSMINRSGRASCNSQDGLRFLAETFAPLRPLFRQGRRCLKQSRVSHAPFAQSQLVPRFPPRWKALRSRAHYRVHLLERDQLARR